MISKEDKIWQTIKFKALSPAQIYSKFKKSFLKNPAFYSSIYEKIRQKIAAEKQKAIDKKQQQKLERLMKKSKKKNELKLTKK